MAATATQPCSTQGGSSATIRSARANHARPAVRLPSPVASTSPSCAQAIAARRVSPAAVSARTAADRWVTAASTSSAT